MSSNILTKRLKDEMKKQNWTGRALSVEANLSYNAIHYIISGKNKSTNFEVVSAIASVLKVSPFYLLDENCEKTNKNDLNSRKLIKEETGKTIPYDGEIYRDIMSIVEELLTVKNSLTTGRIEYFTHYIYSQIQKMDFEGQGENRQKNIKSYAEGIIDYALNRME